MEVSNKRKEVTYERKEEIIKTAIERDRYTRTPPDKRSEKIFPEYEGEEKKIEKVATTAISDYWRDAHSHSNKFNVFGKLTKKPKQMEYKDVYDLTIIKLKKIV